MGILGVAVFLGAAIVGAVSLGGLLNKYAGVFGVFKAYLVCCVSCAAFSQLISETKPSVLMIIAGLVGSYLLAFVLTRNASPAVWASMILVGFGWTLRLLLSFIGFAMPISMENAKRDMAREAAEQERRLEEERKMDEIKRAAYREYGVRGQVNSDGSRWRADSESSWIKVDPCTGKPNPEL